MLNTTYNKGVHRMVNYIVEFYEKRNGEEPAKDFILSLDTKMRAKVLRVIDLLETNGPILGMPYSKPLGDGIFELRVQYSTDIIRVLYFFFRGKKIILTNGFVKKTQKTPYRVVERARNYRQDYERSHFNEQL
jgi:phage-related protein